jgi:COMPASS component SWD3
LVTGGLEQHLRVWSSSNGKLIRSLRTNSGVLSVSLSPNLKILAAGGFNRKIGLWDLNTGKEFLTLTGHIDGVSCLTFSSDGQTLISGSWDKTIKIWQLDTGKEVCTLNEHLDKVTSVAIAPDGKTIISGSADNTIKIWRQT